MRLFFCPYAVNETASGFRWVLFPAFGQHKEVMLLTEKSREEEKLSFKEQILRDLERVKKHEEDQEEVNLASSLFLFKYSNKSFFTFS